MRKKERRNFLRVSTYHLAKYKASPEAGGHVVPMLAFLRDIGAGGVCLRATERIPLLSILQLKINFPSLKDPIFALAKVMWVKQIKKDKAYDLGLQFIEMDDLVRNLIDKKLKFVFDKTQHRKKA